MVESNDEIENEQDLPMKEYFINLIDVLVF
jgi:hypothetical protein